MFGQYGNFTNGNQNDPSDGCNTSAPSATYPSPSPASRYTLCMPEGVWVDANGTLFVADTYNSRVLVYFNAASKPSDAPADMVLGQANFSDGYYNDTPAGGSGTFTCPAADSNVGPATQCMLAEPWGVSTDSTGDLLVADTGNSRVLLWPASDFNPTSHPGCATTCFIPATRVWGQYGSFQTADNNPNRRSWAPPGMTITSTTMPGRT